jgi:hypothetical protein
VGKNSLLPIVGFMFICFVTCFWFLVPGFLCLVKGLNSEFTGYPKPRRSFLRTSNLFVIHYSLFPIHYSLFTIHYSLFPIHYSLFTIRCPLFVIHYSLSTIRYSLFTFRFPQFLLPIQIRLINKPGICRGFDCFNSC